MDGETKGPDPLTLRMEKPGEEVDTEAMVREAFWNLFQPGADEHFLLHNLRKDPAYLPELSLVCEKMGKIVGQVACSRAHIVGKDKKAHDVILLGPISVSPACQGEGIGASLLEAAIAKARERPIHATAIVLLGYPMYYSKFGFVNSHPFRISLADGTFPLALQVLELLKDSLKGIEGRLAMPGVFDVDQKALHQFDQKFPEKLKCLTKSQKAFQTMVGLSFADRIPEFVLQHYRDRTPLPGE